MGVQLTIDFETLVELVDQLPLLQKFNLMQHLVKTAQERELTAEEKIALLKSTVIDLGPVSPDFSFRREDWYGDDGR